MSPARRQLAVQRVKALGYSERRICCALGVSRSAVRYEPQPREDESALTGANIRHDNWVKLRKAALVQETTVTAILDRLVERHVKDYKL